MQTSNTIIIGASAAGLSCAAELSERNVDYLIIEKHSVVGHAWRNHYDRLHLHTNKASSALPYKKFDSSIGKYPARLEVVNYLEEYAELHALEPLFDTVAQKIYKVNNQWNVETNGEKYGAENLVICTGNTNVPCYASKTGIDTFSGDIMHSSEYKNGQKFKDKNVLVVGFGNSACEIAICLHEHGAKPSLSVRSPVNVIPRDIAGIPVLALGIAMAKLPPRLADNINKPLINLLIGNIEKYGLKKAPFGPIEQIVTYQKIPLLDIGTMKLIKEGKIPVYGDVTEIQGAKIEFEDDKSSAFDAIILATGYETGLDKIMDISEERALDMRLNIKKRKLLGKDNLYFCGFNVAPTGMLREIAIESGVIANQINST